MLTIQGLMLQVALNQITPVCNLVSIHCHVSGQCLLRPLSITASVLISLQGNLHRLFARSKL